jgi:hypothetical protein
MLLQPPQGMPTVDSHSVSRSSILTNNTELTESPKKCHRREDDTAASSLSYWPFSPEAYHLFKPRSGTGISKLEFDAMDSTPVFVSSCCGKAIHWFVILKYQE